MMFGWFFWPRWCILLHATVYVLWWLWCSSSFFIGRSSCTRIPSPWISLNIWPSVFLVDFLLSTWYSHGFHGSTWIPMLQKSGRISPNIPNAFRHHVASKKPGQPNVPIVLRTLSRLCFFVFWSLIGVYHFRNRIFRGIYGTLQIFTALLRSFLKMKCLFLCENCKVPQPWATRASSLKQ